MRPIKIVSTVRTATFLAVFAGTSFAQIKNVAVIETDIDAQSGANAQITSADARQLTAELRREAVNNLPTDKYNVMTSETVYAQGGAVLESCADENCVITLGSKIGADYIVRGTISKFQTLFTLVVEIYDTEDGNLAASSDPIRSRNVEELLEKTATACAKMYRTFADAQNRARKPPATYSVTVNVNPAKGGYVYPNVHKTDVKAGDELTLTAMAYQGYTFAGWAGAGAVTPETTNYLKITVDGDMEIVANFIRETKAKGAAKRWGAPEVAEGVGEGGKVRGGVDWYFAPRYRSLLNHWIVASDPATSDIATNIEFGLVWGHGLFLGVDASVGGELIRSFYGDPLGVGINFGKLYDLTEDLQLVYGGSIVWDDILNGIDFGIFISGGLGPFVRLRWRYLELAYRGLLEYSDSYRYLAYNSQLMLGLYFATSNRTKPSARTTHGEKEKKVDWYFAPRYQVPGLDMTPRNGAVNAEFGIAWGKGTFLGLELDGGYDNDYSEMTVGAAINFGSVYDLPAELQFVYGWSVGVLYMSEGGYNYFDEYQDYYPYYHGNSFGFGGPFVRLRRRYLELSYRGLIGYDGRRITHNNQLSIGLYFATTNRAKPH